MASVLKDVSIDKIDELVHMYNNTYQSAIEIKPTDVKSSTYFDFSITKMIRMQNSKLLTM